MNTFGKELIRSLEEAVLHAKGDGPATVQLPATPQDSAEPDAPPRRRPVASKPPVA